MAKYISDSSKIDDLNGFKKILKSKTNRSIKNNNYNDVPTIKRIRNLKNFEKQKLIQILKLLIYCFLFFLWLGFSFSEFGILFNIFIICLIIYFAPAIIGFKRKKLNANSIFVLNFFFGWSIFGWVLALIWAISNSNI